MSLKTCYFNQKYRVYRYANGLCLMALGESHYALQVDHQSGLSVVQEEGIVTDALLRRLESEGWIFTDSGVLTRYGVFDDSPHQESQPKVRKPR